VCCVPFSPVPVVQLGGGIIEGNGIITDRLWSGVAGMRPCAVATGSARGPARSSHPPRFTSSSWFLHQRHEHSLLPCVDIGDPPQRFPLALALLVGRSEHLTVCQMDFSGRDFAQRNSTAAEAILPVKAQSHRQGDERFGMFFHN